MPNPSDNNDSDENKDEYHKEQKANKCPVLFIIGAINKVWDIHDLANGHQ